MEGQRTVVATLGTLAEAVAHEQIKAPALIVVGQVVARRESLAWLERRPLYGRRVVVTRARAQASGLAKTLRNLGAEVVELPAIRIEPRIESDQVRQRPSDRQLLADRPHQPQRGSPALRGDAKRRARRTRPSPARPSPRSAPAPRGPWRTRHRRRHRSRALRRRVAGRGAGRGRGQRQARPRRPRRRRPRRPPRAPRGPRRRGRHRRPLRDRARGARRRGGRGCPSCRLRHLHLVLDRAQPDRGARRAFPEERPHRLDRPCHQRGRPRRRPRGRRRSRAP